MLVYFLGGTLLLPMVLALFFLLNKNGLRQRAAVFFMAAGLFVCTGWAMAHGTEMFKPSAELLAILGPAFMTGNFVGPVILAWLAWLWKNPLMGGLAAIQGALLGWFCWQSGGIVGDGTLVMDHLAILMMLLVDGVGPIILLFALRHMKSHESRRPVKKSRQAQFFAASSVLLGAMNGLLLVNNLLWVLFFWQVVVACAFVLIAHERTQAAIKNARHMLALNSIGVISFLIGIILVYDVAKTLTVSDLLVLKEATQLLAPFAFFALAGFVISAQFPFQSGLIRSISAPAPVSALLQSVALVNAGVYLIFRLSPVFMNTWLAKGVAVSGAFTFAAAALLSIMQHDDKRILALSTISSMGLIIALSCFADLQAIYAAAVLIVLHGASKGLLLICTGNRSTSPIPPLLTLLGAVSMLMPPFGIPAAQWIAMEASVRNPVALLLIIAGAVFTMVFWTRFLGKRLSTSFATATRVGMNPVLHYPELLLSLVVLLLGVFLIPITKYSVTPILKENYARFGDIAKEDSIAFAISDFSGVDPLVFFVGLMLTLVLGWITFKILRKRGCVELPVPEKTEEPAEGSFSLFPRELVHSPRCSVLSGFPDEQKTYLYANMIAGALIILMFEVIVR